jgi:phage terminase large subunit
MLTPKEREQAEIEYIKLLKAEERYRETERSCMAAVGGGYNEFWNDKHRYRVLKGGRGSKKSTTAALWYIYNMMKYPLSNTLVVRNTGATHKDSTFAMLKWAARRLGVYDKWKFVENPLECRYIPTGQKILFRGFDDPLKLTSITVDIGILCWVWMEEAFEISDEEDFRTLDETIRGENPSGLWKQITLTYNPWINSHWTKKRFFDSVDPDAFTLTTTYKCNEWLDEADRKLIEDLEFTNPARYKVVGLGEYGMPGGNYFEEFSESVHVIKPFILDSGHRIYRFLDYGLDKLACYWVSVDYQGRAKIYKELWESDLIISQAAQKIMDMTLPTENIYQTIAPPDLWNRRQDTGKSAAQIFQENGIYLTQANNEREQGCFDMKEWLCPYDTKDEQTGDIIKTANIQMTSNCVNLINSLSNIQKDVKNPNVYATEPHNLTHSVDALRYFCAGRPYPAKVAAELSRTTLLDKLGIKKDRITIKEW